MMKLTRFTPCILLLLAAVSATAQEKYFYVAWDMNVPLSSRSWVGNASTSGVKAGYRVFVTPVISVGLDISSVAFDEYFPTETMEYPGGAITTDYFNYIYSNTAVLSGQYNRFLNESETIIAYGGLGLGANVNEYVMYYNIYDDRDRAWGFVARPEAGISFRFGRRRNMAVMAAVHYDFSTNRSDSFDYKNFSKAGFQLGLMFWD